VSSFDRSKTTEETTIITNQSHVALIGVIGTILAEPNRRALCDGKCTSLPRILIIEDDSSVAAVLQQTLENEGFDAVCESDAENGMRTFASSGFDLAIVDIFMPGINGIEVITQLRNRAPAVPLIAMSGFWYRGSADPGLDFLGMAAQAGAKVCLRKPFTPRQLLAAVCESLERPLPFITAPDPGTEGKDNHDGA
jgi:DNA-binding response OmpR family regulator